MTLLIEGEPSEVFPGELRHETYTYEDGNGNLITGTKEVEPLATNIIAPSKKESFKKLKQEYLRLVAPLLGCRFDDLYNRNQRRRNRRNLSIAASLIVILAMFGIYNSIMRFQINTQRAEAQANYEEAEIQRLLALTNLEEAETQRAEAEMQRTEAETQRAEADAQREQAVLNLEEVKSLLLSNAIDYAERLNEQGARSRAGAVLRKAYENIDENHEKAEFLYARFRDVAIDTLFYMDESLPFAKQNLSGEIRQIDVDVERGFAIATTENYLYKIDLGNGDILNSYTAPEGDQFLVVTVQGEYILAVTAARYILQIHTAMESDDLLISDKPVIYYDGDDVIKINYNETISALTIVHYVEVWHHRNLKGLTDETYVSAGEKEVFSKVILTVIPWDFEASTIELEVSQVFTYRADPSLGWWYVRPGVRMSENGRFLAVKNQQYYTVTKGTTLGEFRGTHTYVNSEVIVIDIDNFDVTRDIAENHVLMTQTFDVRFNNEELFIIDDFSISEEGVLIIDGRAEEENEAVGQEARTIAYDIQNEVMTFNERLRVDLDEHLECIFIELLECDCCARSFRDKAQNREGYIHTACSERWLLYLHEKDGESLLIVYDIFEDVKTYVEYLLPNGFILFTL